MTPNQRLLAGIVKKVGAAHVARSLHVDESAVRFWARGKRTPTPQMQEKLARFDVRLSGDGWLSGRPDPKPATESVRELEEGALASVEPSSDIADTLRRLDRHLARAEAEPTTPTRDITGLLLARSVVQARLDKARQLAGKSITDNAQFARFVEAFQAATKKLEHAIEREAFDAATATKDTSYHPVKGFDVLKKYRGEIIRWIADFCRDWDLAAPQGEVNS